MMQLLERVTALKNNLQTLTEKQVIYTTNLPVCTWLAGSMVQGFRHSPCLVSCLGMIEAGADIVLLYGHFGPKLALRVFTPLDPLPSDCCDC